MLIEDEFVIDAPLEEAWAFLLDIPRVSQCVPGVKDVKQVDEDSYRGTLSVRVGPIAANFNGKVVLEEVHPPHRLSAAADARDQTTASMASIKFSANLTEVDTDQTEVAFTVDAAIRGRLGQFGQGVILETAKQMTRAFAECLQAHLEQSSRREAVQDAAHASSVSMKTSPPAGDFQPSPPSLLSISIKSVINTIVNWFRSLGSA